MGRVAQVTLAHWKCVLFAIYNYVFDLAVEISRLERKES